MAPLSGPVLPVSREQQNGPVYLQGDRKGSESLRALCGWNKVLRVMSVNVGMLDLSDNQLGMGMAQARATQQSSPGNTDTALGKARKVVGGCC